MFGIDIIGAGESLAPYTVMLRIKSVDPAKLKETASASSWAAAIPGAVQMMDAAPELALEIALPIVQKEMEKIGITADITKTKTPPKGSTSYEMLVVLGLGTVGGVVLALFGKTLYNLIKVR